MRYDVDVNDSFWQGGGQVTAGRILFGRLGEESATHPGVYAFLSNTGFRFPDAHILSSDADVSGAGENTRPRAGSYCVAVITNDGAQCFIVGFMRLPTVDETKDEAPSVGNPEDNNSAGDKVYRTAGDATLVLKRGGAVIIEGGAGTGVILNPLNNAMTLRASNFTQIADGFSATRGRFQPGKIDPRTYHEEVFQDQVGPTYDQLALTHGTLGTTAIGTEARRQFTIEHVTTVGSSQTSTLKTRESYDADGTWIGEGPKYMWGGADATEPAVLGNALVEAFGKLFDIIKALKVNTAWGPSTPPLPPTPLDLEELRSELSDKILSTFAFFAKNPADL